MLAAAIAIGVVASATVAARRRVRLAVRATLTNYASVVTEQFANGAETLLRQNWAPILPPPGAVAPAVLPDPIPLQDLAGMIRRLREDPCACYLDAGATVLFRGHRERAQFIAVDSALRPVSQLDSAVASLALRLADTVALTGWRYGYGSVATPAGPQIVFVSQRRAAEGEHYIYGMVVPADHLAREVFARTYRTVRLVPRFLLASVPDNQGFVGISVELATGEQIFASAPGYAEGPSDRLSLPLGRGGLVVAAHLNPAIKGALLPGGDPPAIPWRELIMLALAFGLLLAIAVVGLRAVQLARIRSDFASSVTHELRTPVTQIRLAAETVLLGRGSAERSLRGIVEETTRLQQLIDNVLHFSRAERRMARVTLEPVAMTPLVEDIVAGFHTAADSGVTWTLDLPPSLRALADPGAVRQVLRNLLDNALRYGPSDGQVRVRGRWEGGHVEIAVEDEGPGIPASDRARVWEPFVRLNSVLETAGTGTGLGLAVVRELMTAQGGDCRIESGEAGGARVLLRWREASA